MRDTKLMVKAIIANILVVEEDEITDDASIRNDLGASSLDMMELIMGFEKEFNVFIPDEDIEKIETVSQAVNYIEEYSKKN